MADDPVKPKPMNKRLYSASASTHARNIMLAAPEDALNWFLEALSKTQNEVRAKMIHEGFIPVVETDEAPTIIVTFDVRGMPAEPTKRANGQDIGI